VSSPPPSPGADPYTARRGGIVVFADWAAPPPSPRVLCRKFERWRTRVFVGNPATLCESCARRDRLVPVTAFTLFLLDAICGCGGGTFTHGRKRIIILYTHNMLHATTNFFSKFSKDGYSRLTGSVFYSEANTHHYSQHTTIPDLTKPPVK